jgi:hypothetical protein
MGTVNAALKHRTTRSCRVGHYEIGLDHAAKALARKREMCQASMYLYGVSPSE